MKITLTIILLSFCTTIYAQKDKSYHNHWHEEGVDDFKSLTSDFKLCKGGGFYYCISNDKDNIYVNLRIFDRDIQQQVFVSGITIWINTKGKRSRKMGVRYPVLLQNQGRDGRPDPQNMQGPPGMQQLGAGQGRTIATNILNSSSLQLIGFNKSGSVIIPSIEKGNFRGSVRIERDNNMYYEVIMPFSKLPPINDKPQGKKKSGSFFLGIGYPGAQSSSLGGSSGGASGMSGGPGGSRPGGGGFGGGRPGGGRTGGDRAPTAEAPSMSSRSPNQSVFWIKDIRLAAEK